MNRQAAPLRPSRRFFARTLACAAALLCAGFAALPARMPVAAATVPASTGGYLLDGYGGIHPFGGATIDTAGAPYWSGWDIARALQVLPGGTGGWVLDGYGGIHAFGDAPAIARPAYWSGWDIARDLAVYKTADGSYAGYVLDGYGGLHPFGGAPALSDPYYWNGFDAARSLSLDFNAEGVPDGGWIFDLYGGIHAFGDAPSLSGYSIYTPGDSVWEKLAVNEYGGYALTVYGGIITSGDAPAVDTSGMPNWGNWGIVRDFVVAGLPAAEFTTGDPAPEGTDASLQSQASSTMDALMNEDRQAQGAAPLAEDPILDAIAGGNATYDLAACGGSSTIIADRADDMYNRQYFNHPVQGCGGTDYVFNTYYPAFGVSYSYAGENIEWSEGQTTLSSSAAEANSLWLASGPHLANILDPDYTEIGCGVSYHPEGSFQGATGPVWIWVCDFAN